MRIHNTKTLAAIVLVLVLAVTVPIVMIPTVKALPTSASLSAVPNPVNIGQSVVLTGDINPNPPSGYFYNGIVLSITGPSGLTSIGPFMSDANGGFWTEYVPSELGTYYVILTCPGQYLGETYYDPCNATTSFSVIDNEPPVASFTYSPPSPVYVGEIITFYASGSYDPDGSIVSWAWNFGDATFGSGKTVSHSYSGAGKYTVTLTVTDNYDATDTDTATITVINPNLPPVANAGGPYTGTEDIPISFDASGSYDLDGSIVSYFWSLGDGSNFMSSSPYLLYAYSDPGIYQVHLTVIDDDDASDSTITTATVAASPNQPPHASFTSSPTSPEVEETVNFDASGSSDSDGSIVSWEWNFGDASFGSGETVSHSYSGAGDYTVTLAVTDDDGATDTATATVTVSAANLPPVADAGGPYTGMEDVLISFNGGSSYDDDGNIVSYSWNFGDGHGSTNQNPTHAYSQGGTYTVSLTVTDNDGATDTDTTTATVTAVPNQPPVASYFYSPPSPVDIGKVIIFDASGSSDPDGTIVDYAWNFGDGTSGTGTSTSHSYSSAGTYTVALTVTDNDGLTDTAIKDVKVISPVEPVEPIEPVEPVEPIEPVEPDVTNPDPDAGNGQTVEAGSAVTFDASESSDNVGIISYEWDFGDGTTGTGLTTTHTYTEPGIYTVTLTVEDEAGNRVTDSCIITVEMDTADEEVEREPRSISIVAQVAVVGTVAVAATAAAASSGAVGQALNSAVGGLPLPDWLKDFLQLYGKDAFETIDKTQLEAMEEVPLITKVELASIAISAITMTVVFSFVEANGLPHFLNPSVLAAVIPAVLLAVFMENIAEVFAEAICTRICNVYRQVKLWVYGTGLFLISGLIFRLPSGAPTITRYQSGQISRKTKALIILSKMLILLTLTVPFAGLYMIGFKTLGDAGLLMTLMIVFYYFIPLKPIIGKAVFDYKKEMSLLALVSTGTLFLSYALNLLPQVVYLTVGVVSVVLAVISLILLRKSSCEVPKPM